MDPHPGSSVVALADSLWSPGVGWTVTSASHVHCDFWISQLSDRYYNNTTRNSLVVFGVFMRIDVDVFLAPGPSA
jgi:hypothetical protein